MLRAPASKPPQANTKFFLAMDKVGSFLQVVHAIKQVHTGKSGDQSAVRFDFNEHGLSLYARPMSTPILACAFMNREMFSDYQFSEQVQVWISKDSLASLDSISETKAFTMYYDEDTSALIVTASHHDSRRTFDCKLYFKSLHNPNEEVLDMDVTHNWKVSMQANNFAKNYALLNKPAGHDKTEFVQMCITATTMLMQSYSTLGYLTMEIKHELNNRYSDKFNANFQTKLLKYVCDAKRVASGIDIHYNLTPQDPVRFTYPLCRNQPQSHLTFYIATALDDEDDEDDDEAMA